MKGPGEELTAFAKLLPKAAALSMVVSLVPLPSNLWLGNSGEGIFALIAPVILVLSTGLVCLVWHIIAGIVRIYEKTVLSLSRYFTFLTEF